MRIPRPCPPQLLVLVVASLVFGQATWGQETTFLQNGGFEIWRQANPDASGLVSGWTLGEPPLVPEGWVLNSAYPGRLTVETDQPHSGKSHARLTAPEKGGCHLYQPCQGLQSGQWYRLSFWMRGGPLEVCFYQYFKSGPMSTVQVAEGRSDPGQWRRIETYYQTPAENYASSSVAFSTGLGNSVDLDDVALERLAAPEVPATAPEIVLETQVTRLTLSPRAALVGFTDKASGRNYAASGAPLPLLTVLRHGAACPAYSLVRKGDLLQARFPDPEIEVSLRVVTRPRHLVFEVVSVAPADVDSLTLQLPVKRLKTVGSAFNATYDGQFGMCLLGITANTQELPGQAGQDTSLLGAACYRTHGLVGAKFALVAAPGDQFRTAIMEAERANGLPCPMLDGKWARDSDAVRRSYLFGVGVTANDVDTLIEYAQVAHFGTVIFGIGDWLENCGHYDINRRNFPGGIADLKRAMDKIHRAGMHAGVHLFGPTISPNDPYVTPKPDDRLASVALPPLAEAVDEKATVLTLTGPPQFPPVTGETAAYPNHYLRVGDEIIRFGQGETGPPFRYTQCQRGALGTHAAPHPAGAPVKGLLAMWGYFLMDPDSSLAEEVTSNFAKVANACGFDFMYFDASDGIHGEGVDRWYYLNKLHLMFYRKLAHDVLYQTSNGTGSGLVWHIVPRSASADGSGDIKGYLDQRWAGILGMADNLTKPDIGWYYWFKEVRPDQIEYVCAKALGVDGSISLETCRASLEALSQSRQMMEMIGRWEQCRRAKTFPETARAKLREPGRDFKLFPDGRGGWQCYRAVYEEPRAVDALDGRQNVWTIKNDRTEPCLLGIEILRSTRPVALAEYNDPRALTIEDFAQPEEYRLSERNAYAKFVIGEGKILTPPGVVKQGVTQRAEAGGAGQVGKQCLLYAADNRGEAGAWSAIGRRFAKPLDLTAYQGLGLWIHGDGQGEVLRIQFRDAAGRNMDFLPAINFKGWNLYTFPFPTGGSFDRSQIEYLLFYFNGMPAGAAVSLKLDSVRALPSANPQARPGAPTIDLNGKQVVFPAALEPGQAITNEGIGLTTLWPGGMKPGRPLAVTGLPLRLQPGDNQVTLAWEPREAFPGAVQVLFYRLWPLEIP